MQKHKRGGVMDKKQKNHESGFSLVELITQTSHPKFGHNA